MKCLSLLFFLTFVINLQAQDNAANSWLVDIKVVDAINKEPVLSKLVYESLPYGDNIGIYQGDSYAFNIPEESSYRIRVTADGYSPYFHNIAVEEFHNGLYEATVELTPNDLNRLIRLDKLIFGLGEAKITPESYGELNTLASMLIDNPTMVIQLEGHTDFRGNARKNLKLSEKRVEAVRDYLMNKGIDKRRIKLKAFGGAEPLTRSNDPESRQKNRRVEVRIIEN